MLFRSPTAEGDERWVVVDLVPFKALPRPVTLAQFKADPILAEAALVKQSCLSVLPMTDAQYRRVLELGGLEG